MFTSTLYIIIYHCYSTRTSIPNLSYEEMGLIKKAVRRLIEEAAPVKEEYLQKPVPKDVESGDDSPKDDASGQGGKTYDISKPNRIFLKPLRVYKLFADTDFRWRFSLHLSVVWGISTIIVGIVFICLAATGVYPESVEIQKELGVFAENLIKYALYILAGTLGLVGAFAARKILVSSKGSSEKVQLTIPQVMLITAVLTALATVAMSIQILVEINNTYPVDGWSWFILVIFVLQRLFLAAACTSATWTLIDASTNRECRDILC